MLIKEWQIDLDTHDKKKYIYIKTILIKPNTSIIKIPNSSELYHSHIHKQYYFRTK